MLLLSIEDTIQQARVFEQRPPLSPLINCTYWHINGVLWAWALFNSVADASDAVQAEVSEPR
jgi:hypothetical protein